MILCPDRDAQEVFDAWFPEMTDQDAALAQTGGKTGTAVAWMAREHKIRLGWQNFEAEVGEPADQRFACFP